MKRSTWRGSVFALLALAGLIGTAGYRLKVLHETRSSVTGGWAVANAPLPTTSATEPTSAKPRASLPASFAPSTLARVSPNDPLVPAWMIQPYNPASASLPAQAH